MRKAGEGLLWYAPPIVVMAAFFASLPWLADIDETLTLSITAAAAMFVVSWARFVVARVERALDEVELAGLRYAQANGAAAGTFVTVLLLLPTPVVGWLTDRLILLTTGLGETLGRDTVYLGMVFGMVLLVLLQAVGTVVANAIWNRRIGGNA
jgi:hypothetical protein